MTVPTEAEIRQELWDRTSRWSNPEFTPLRLALADWVISLTRTVRQQALSIEISEMAGEHRAYAAVERHVLGTEPLPEGHHTAGVLQRVTEARERTAAVNAAVGMREAAILSIDQSRDKVGRLMHESWTRTKREQGFHHPDEIGHGITGPPCPKCHADLVDWDQLPQRQKDINCKAFDDVLPMLKESIRALPLDPPLQSFVQKQVVQAYERCAQQLRNGCMSDFDVLGSLKQMEQWAAESRQPRSGT